MRPTFHSLARLFIIGNSFFGLQLGRTDLCTRGMRIGDSSRYRSPKAPRGWGKRVHNNLQISFPQLIPLILIEMRTNRAGRNRMETI